MVVIIQKTVYVPLNAITFVIFCRFAEYEMNVSTT